LEIGVFHGGNAVSMLRNLKIKKLYLVDPYLEYDSYKESSAKWSYNQIVYDKIYETTKKRMRKYGDKVKLIRESSSNVVIDDKFDLIYLDGNYSEVINDFEKFFPMLNKHNGIIGGYAFTPSHLQLVRDVLKIVEIYDLEVYLGGGYNEWWLSF